MRDGQALALKKMKPGVDGLKLHNEVKQLFTDRGFPTEVRDGRQVGFFHGTGHGLGLEIHEFPRFQKTVFKPGQVLTVEPGLYYPGNRGRAHRRRGGFDGLRNPNVVAFREAARNLNEPGHEGSNLTSLSCPRSGMRQTLTN